MAGGPPTLINTSFMDMTGSLQDLFGRDASVSTSGSGSSKTTGKQTEKLNIDQEAVMKIIQDVLGGAGGLAELFSTENVSGLYNSTAAVQAAGDLASKLVGEIAKLTAEKESTVEESTTSSQASQQGQESEGILEQAFDSVGKIFSF